MITLSKRGGMIRSWEGVLIWMVTTHYDEVVSWLFRRFETNRYYRDWIVSNYVPGGHRIMPQNHDRNYKKGNYLHYELS